MREADIKSGKITELIVKAIIFAAMGLGLTILLLLGISALMSAGGGLEEYNDEYVIICTIAGSAFSGAMCARGRQGGVLVAGFAAAAAYVLLLSMGSLFVPADANSGSILLKNIIAAIVGGVFGGTLRLYRKNKKSKLRR